MHSLQERKIISYYWGQHHEGYYQALCLLIFIYLYI